MFYLPLNTRTVVTTLLLSSALVVSPAYALSDIEDTCSSAASLFKEGDVEGALEEARWCVTQLEQLKQGQTSSFFKDNISGYAAGKLEFQQVMGLTVIERTYVKGNDSVQVSLSGGESGITNNAFAAIASFGMQAVQGKKVRIQRRTGTINNDNGSAQLMVTLKSGGILTFGSSQLSEDALIAFAKSFPVAELDDSRK